ncbi:cupin domain-containing protein [Novosphingobium album (ex Hu et al. 2023)]|uniref:Cupin domain-containing protein n=1 Tax=Novosphingobium album (ex Hu et al. 2023) TaxID=2930093 RepID=A0ABT0B1P8_9SPHN|nr:cupin domain-containing protein [Novosphingobium album (ex Hu et al. 2023)]MCJ2179001.1 cupin domain-containing protein [Novosphingobium album (ex Hu et al. 2023)]
MRRIAATGILALMTAQPASAQEGGMEGTPSPAVIDQSNAEHYVWGGVNDGWHLLKRRDLSIIRERMVPGGAEVPHRHAKSRQFFQVLAGELSIRTETGMLTIKAGQGAEIAPGLLHQAINGTNEPAEFLVVSMPPSHGDRIEGSFPTP